MRLDKYLSKALQISRSDAEVKIKSGKVLVNGEVTRQKQYPVKEELDIIIYNGNKITYREFVYFMMNKPSGVVSAVRDSDDKTVVDLIQERKDVFPVGRLDKDVEGLLILTNNGKLAHHLTSPKHEVKKRYYVQTKNPLSEKDIISFHIGLMIRDGDNHLFQTKPALLEIVDDNSCYVTITEGKFHQVKRMFVAIENEVVYLKRVAMGNLKLDVELPLGMYRSLNDEEIFILKTMSNFKI